MKKWMIFLFILVFLFCFSNLYSEEIKIDSLKKDYTNLDDISFYIMVLNPSMDYKEIENEFLESKISYNLGIMYSTPIYERTKLNIGLEYLNYNYNIATNSDEYKFLGLRSQKSFHINIPVLLSYYVNFKNFYPKIDYILKAGLNYSYFTSFEGKKIVDNSEKVIKYNKNEMNHIFNRSLIWLTLAIDFRIPTKKDLVISIEPRFSSSFVNNYAAYIGQHSISRNYYLTLNLGAVYSF